MAGWHLHGTDGRSKCYPWYQGTWYPGTVPMKLSTGTSHTYVHIGTSVPDRVMHTVLTTIICFLRESPTRYYLYVCLIER